MKRIRRNINIYEYTIFFSYETRKGYYREQQIIMPGFNKEDAATEFMKWANKQRTMSNVKILGIVKREQEIKSIEV